MEKTVVRTSMFKDIFPDYNTFSEWYQSTPLSDEMYIVPEEKTFTLIAYEYNCSHVAMSDVDFKQHFAVDLYTYAKEFEETTKAINELMQLSDDDIKRYNTQVNNTAQLPETDYDTDNETVNFISGQQKTFMLKDKQKIKREQIANKRTLTVRTFLKRFKHLFRICLDEPYTFVIEEPLGV